MQTFCPTTVGISSDIGKLCSANVQSLTVIFRPESTILWNPHILCMNMYDENQAQGWSMDQVHESGPWTRSMDQVHGPQGGPWTGSTGVVHGPGSMFCIRPYKFVPKSPCQIIGLELACKSAMVVNVGNLFTCKSHEALFNDIIPPH